MNSGETLLFLDLAGSLITPSTTRFLSEGLSQSMGTWIYAIRMYHEHWGSNYSRRALHIQTCHNKTPIVGLVVV